MCVESTHLLCAVWCGRAHTVAVTTSYHIINILCGSLLWQFTADYVTHTPQQNAIKDGFIEMNLHLHWPRWPLLRFALPCLALPCLVPLIAAHAHLFQFRRELTHSSARVTSTTYNWKESAHQATSVNKDIALVNCLDLSLMAYTAHTK